MHQVVIGCDECLITCLAHLLGDICLRVGFFKTESCRTVRRPVFKAGTVSAGKVVDFSHVGNDGHAVGMRESPLADIAVPVNRIASHKGSVDYHYQLIKGDIVEAVHLPVVGHLYKTFTVEGEMCERGYMNIIVHLQPQAGSKGFRGVALTFVCECFGCFPKVDVEDGIGHLM